MGNVPGAKEVGARARLYDLIAHVESHLAFEDIEAFVLLVMDVQHTPVAIRGEYLYYGVPFSGLLLRGLYGGQHPQPPPCLAFTRLVREGPALGFFCIEYGPRPNLVFCSRHSVFLLPYTVVCRERCQRTNRLSRLNAHICAIISSMARKYEMKRRAQRMQETRQRITEAAIELHQTVGPARAT